MSTPDGWVLVPVEATEEMLQAGIRTGELESFNRVCACWQMMVLAAPKPPEGEPA